MGCAREYWTDILKRLHKKYGNQPFRWADVYQQFPDITKSNLTRLRSSDWIKMTNQDKKTGMWKLTNDAVRFCNTLETAPHAANKAKRVRKKAPATQQRARKLPQRIRRT